MAFTQKPGRTPFLKTGNGLPSALRQEVDPKLQKVKEQEDRVNKAVKSFKSNRSFNSSELAIEKAAVNDSIIAANPKNPHLFTDREKKAMGNAAANATRSINNANNIVEKKEVFNRKTGYGDVYRRKPIEKKSPLEQRVSKKTAYDIKEASNQKLKPGARKHYAENAQAAMKNKKKK